MGVKKPVAEEGFGKSKKNRGRYTVTALALSCVCACIVVMCWIRSSKRVETDNAYVETRIIPLTAKISGTIKTAMLQAESQLKAARDSYRQILAEAGLEKGGCVRAKVLQRLAQLEEARLHLSYTRIVAPAGCFAGYYGLGCVERA